MSELILPEGVKSSGFIQGRRLKSSADLEAYIGCVLVLRNASKRAEQACPHFVHSKIVGTIQMIGNDPAYPKRALGIVVLSILKPGMFLPCPVEVLEESDPWCHPPGMPERAVSLLED